jgi:hypothetical protein
MRRTVTLSATVAAAFAVGVVSTLVLSSPTASALDASGDPCRYYPRAAPAAVACTGSRCVVCADGSCRQFAPVVCWTTERP